MDIKIIENLKKLFEKHRIIFWYDDKKELREDFDNLYLDDVEKIEIKNNEYSLKYKILRENPTQKFLLYFEGPKPKDRNNWLLDVLLSNKEFKVDHNSIMISELNLDNSYIRLLDNYKVFFNSAKRVSELKKLMNTVKDKDSFITNLLAVCAKSDIADMNVILLNLINDLMKDDLTSFNLIQKCNLEDSLWTKVNDIYGYNSSDPSLSDFIHEIFNECFNYELKRTINLKQDAILFINNWENNKNYSETFEHFANICEENLEIKNKIETIDYRELYKIDYFSCIDKAILNHIISEIAEETITSKTVEEVIRLRNRSFWYDKFENYYEALKYSSLYFSKINEIELRIQTLEDSVKSYVDSWFLVDQYYRKFLYFSKKVANSDSIKGISTKVENSYSNNHLLRLNDKWQNLVDQNEEWKIKGYVKQSNFYNYYVSQKVNSGKKICVIISDAMRYEIGEELSKRINSENRLISKIEPMISSIPSYTQLGMASLLPNESLKIKDDAYVIVDGKSSQGTVNRDKILKTNIDDNAVAIDIKKIDSMKTDELKVFVRNHSIMYIYHDVIDSTGGDTNSTEKVNDAAEQTINDLTRISKKLANCNANNIIITADHGFIYQDNEIDESDFVGNKVDSDGIVYNDRRMILGRNLSDNSSLKHFTSKQLGLNGDLEVQIAKSINRLRKKGSGTKFVHGGASLQEVILPVILINNKKKNNTSQVNIELHTGGKNIITSGQLAIRLYQSEPISDKLKKRDLKVGLYSKEDELISDEKDFIFDFTSESPRDREITERFVLSSKANNLNRQEVFLRLQEPIEGTTKYKLYKEIKYSINRQISTDFDF